MNFTGIYDNTFSYRSHCCASDGKTNKCCRPLRTGTVKHIPNMNTPESGALSTGKSIGLWLTIVVGVLGWLALGMV